MQTWSLLFDLRKCTVVCRSCDTFLTGSYVPVYPETSFAALTARASGEKGSFKMAFVSGARLTWPQIRSTGTFQGCWVALDQCRYEDRGGAPTEGTVVDFDADLVALCERMREADSRHCAILYCEGDHETPVSSSRPPSAQRGPTPIPGRQLRH